MFQKSLGSLIDGNLSDNDVVVVGGKAERCHIYRTLFKARCNDLKPAGIK